MARRYEFYARVGKTTSQTQRTSEISFICLSQHVMFFLLHRQKLKEMNRKHKPYVNCSLAAGADLGIGCRGRAFPPPPPSVPLRWNLLLQPQQSVTPLLSGAPPPENNAGSALGRENLEYLSNDLTWWNSLNKLFLSLFWNLVLLSERFYVGFSEFIANRLAKMGAVQCNGANWRHRYLH